MIWLYLGDVCLTIHVIGITVLVMTTIGLSLLGFMLLVGLANDDFSIEDVINNTSTALKHKLVKLLLTIYIAISSIAILTPSDTFCYMMAAKDIGTEAVSSELGQKAIKLLNQKLDEELNKHTENKK